MPMTERIINAIQRPMWLLSPVRGEVEVLSAALEESLTDVLPAALEASLTVSFAEADPSSKLIVTL